MRFFVAPVLKPDEVDWLEGEAERLGVNQSVIVRHAIQSLQERPLAELPWDREIVLRRKGISKVVKVDIDQATLVRGESWRLGASQSDLVRQAIVRLREEGPLSVPQPTDRRYWWKSTGWPKRARYGAKRRRRLGLRRLIGAIFGDR
jgi:Arc/MetJ-type ribon-helix-helix transcriptional regulator